MTSKSKMTILPSSNKILFVFSFLISILFFEIVFRFYSIDDLRGLVRNKTGERLSECLVKDKNLDHVLQPNCSGKIVNRDFKTDFKTNNLGFVGPEISDKKDDRLRVVLVGDSFVEGWGVNIKDRFDQINLDGVEIINIGVRSYSPFLEKILLDKYLDKINPDLVIQFLDFSDFHDDFYYMNKMGVKIDSYPYQENSFFLRLINKSSLLTELYKFFATRFYNNKRELRMVNLTNDIALFARAYDWQNYDRAWDLVRKNISETKNMLLDKSIDYSLVVVPRGIHVGEKEWDDARVVLGLKRDLIYDPPEIFKMSEIDLLKDLKEAEKESPGDLYFSFDGHWTPRGHAVVKQSVEEYLTKYQKTKEGSE